MDPSMSDEHSPRSGAASLSRCEPVRVWFAWHPGCPEGRRLAEGLASALGDLGGGGRAGTGVPVYFATSVDGARVPLAVPGAAPGEQVILVPLLDAGFVADPRWRRWLSEACPRMTATLPVAIDRSAYRLESVQGLGHLPFDGDAERLQRVMLVEIARLLLRERPKLFLSYASQDGALVAGNLRDAVARYPRMDFFLDEDALAAGEHFPAALKRAIDAEVPAMLAIHTDHYGTRPWCRRELAAFRRPTTMPSGTWHLRPLLVVDSLRHGVARVLGELAGAPLVRYEPGQETRILDRLVQCLLLSEYHCRRAEHIAALDATSASPPTAIDWVPDVHTMTELRRVGVSEADVVCFPGDGLDPLEIEAVREAHHPQRLVTFDSACEARTAARATPRTVVGLSIGEPDSDELVVRGLGSGHLDAVVHRLSRLLIGHRVDVSFGGRADNRFGVRLDDELRRFVRVEDALIGASVPRAADGLPLRPLLVEFGREPGDIDAGRVADGLDIVRFVPAAHAGWRAGFERALPALPVDVAGPLEPLVAMRWTMNGETVAVDGARVRRPIARVLVGGRLEGYSGVLPGVMEEALYAHARGVPLFIVGLLGGAAAAVGRVVLEGARAGDLFRRQPPEVFLGPEYFIDPDYGDPRTPAGSELASRYAAIERWVEAVDRLHGASLDNGLTPDDNRRLFEARDLDTVIHLLSRGLTALLERAGRLAEPAAPHS